VATSARGSGDDSTPFLKSVLGEERSSVGRRNGGGKKEFRGLLDRDHRSLAKGSREKTLPKKGTNKMVKRSVQGRSDDLRELRGGDVGLQGRKKK